MRPRHSASPCPPRSSHEAPQAELRRRQAGRGRPGPCAARADRASLPAIRKFVQIYQTSPVVQAQILQSFAGNRQLYSLP